MSASEDPSGIRTPRVREVRDYARRHGWARTAQRAAHLAVNQVAAWSIFECYFLQREHWRGDLLAAGAGCEGRFLGAGEVEELAGRLGGSLRGDLCAAAARGDEVYVLIDGDQVATVACYATRSAPLMQDLEVRFEPPAVYTYRHFTPRAYRGRGLHAVGILRAAHDLFTRGVPRLLAVCERTNYPAAASFRRMGWQSSGTLWRAGLGPFHKLGRSPEAAALGMDLALRRPAQHPL